MSFSQKVDDAMAVAMNLHRDQVRKATAVPYVTHLWSVAALVSEMGGDEEEVIAALLHDAVEDQGGQATLNMIREKFGVHVAEIVWGCTDADTVPKPPWRQRKEDYIARLQEESLSVVRVSLADKIHNARTILSELRQIGREIWKKFTGGRDGTLWYYTELVATYRNKIPGPGAEEIARVVAEIKSLDAQYS